MIRLHTPHTQPWAVKAVAPLERWLNIHWPWVSRQRLHEAERLYHSARLRLDSLNQAHAELQREFDDMMRTLVPDMPEVRVGDHDQYRTDTRERDYTINIAACYATVRIEDYRLDKLSPYQIRALKRLVIEDWNTKIGKQLDELIEAKIAMEAA